VTGMTGASPIAAAANPPPRRKLRFETIDDALREAQQLAEAERLGRLARAGNWTLGQTLGHLGTWVNFAFDGYPASVHAPLPVRMILRLMRNRILNQGMMTGVKIGRVPGGTLGLDAIPAEEGLVRYRTALQRLRQTAPTIDNPVFGKLTHEQWVQLNLRHAELHLGFQVPR
jgi:Protein of unknown function (DUF1569)